MSPLWAPLTVSGPPHPPSPRRSVFAWFHLIGQTMSSSGTGKRPPAEPGLSGDVRWVQDTWPGERVEMALGSQWPLSPVDTSQQTARPAHLRAGRPGSPEGTSPRGPDAGPGAARGGPRRPPPSGPPRTKRPRRKTVQALGGAGGGDPAAAGDTRRTTCIFPRRWHAALEAGRSGVRRPTRSLTVTHHRAGQVAASPHAQHACRLASCHPARGRGDLPGRSLPRSCGGRERPGQGTR